jgi:teichoic acid transport system ATP-binding protein
MILFKNMKKKNNNIVLSLKNINKIYSLSDGKKFYALKNINIDIGKGDRIGIIGDNGAGKTTLLKIISGITKQTSGEIKRQGKIVSLMDLESGFDPELTGYENILVNGLLIGMTKKEIITKLPSIIHFADIGNFINEPFYIYSAGMKFRLAIAIAITSLCEILIIDEILMSGDINFQNKVIHTLQTLQKKTNITMIICSHIPETIWSLANTFYVVKNGSIKKIDRNEVKKLTLIHHVQFHKTFKTEDIKEFNTKKINSSINKKTLAKK